MRRGIFALALLLAAGGAAADPAAVTIRTGSHPGFGRVVFDLPAGVSYEMAQGPDRVDLHFSPAAPVPAPSGKARNVVSIETAPGTAILSLTPGAKLRATRIDGRLVVDVLDAAVTVAAAPLPLPPIPPDEPPPIAEAQAVPPAPVAQTAIPPSPEPEKPAQAAPERPPAPIEIKPPSAQMPAPAPIRLASAPDDGPLALSATRVTVPGASAAYALPFRASTGAAAFRRGNQMLLLFDQRLPLDLSSVRDDPLLGAASVQLLAAGTLIKLPLPPGQDVTLLRTDKGSWTVALMHVPPAHPIHTALAGTDAGTAQMKLPAKAPGQVLSMADPATGALLLVGTAQAPGEAVAATRQTPRYRMLPTLLGVAVQPLSDRVTLRAGADGFLLAGVDPPGPTTERQEDASALTRRFDFPGQPTEALQRRLQAQMTETAQAPPLARGRTRLAAAQTMIALGLGVEAEALLQVAAEQDPDSAAAPTTAGLAAIAALLAGRDGDSAPIEDAALSGSDEVAMWRAIRRSHAEPGAPDAAAVFAATLPLAEAYPEGLRTRLLPDILETMIAGGEAAAATDALARTKDDPSLALARAMKKQADGDIDGALAAYDVLAADPDRRQRAWAGEKAVALRIATGRIAADAAADAYDAQLYAWRGDRHELELREKLAKLRAEAGGYRPALALLRETLPLFPEQKPEIMATVREIFAALLCCNHAEALAPLELVALLDENAALLGETDQDGIGALQAPLAEKLLALDLPKRAAPQLDRLLRQAAPGTVQAGFGASLASLWLREGDPKQALAALEASSTEALPDKLTLRRALLTAQAAAKAGDPGAALAVLAPLDGNEVLAAKATILEQAKDWASASATLDQLAKASLPAEGPLDQNQARLLLRLASAAAEAGDEGLLARLRAEAPRLQTGPLADTFKLLTADKIQSPDDLKRSGQELNLAKALPASLSALTK